MSHVAADTTLETLTLTSTSLVAVYGDSGHCGCGHDELMCEHGDKCDCEDLERVMVIVNVGCGCGPSWRRGDWQGAGSGEESDLGDHNPHYHSSQIYDTNKKKTDHKVPPQGSTSLTFKNTHYIH